MKPKRVTASELQRSFGSLSDQALREPVTITKQGRDHLVLLAADEYARLKRRDRRVTKAEDLPEEIIELIRNTRMDPKYDYLNEELKDWKP